MLHILWNTLPKYSHLTQNYYDSDNKYCNTVENILISFMLLNGAIGAFIQLTKTLN